MSFRLRHYDHARDFEAVGQFLIRTYSTAGPHVNWLQPRWEYMHFHPHLDNDSLPQIGVWEAGEEMVAVVHHEHSLGEVYFEVAPGHASLWPDMLRFAEKQLVGKDADGSYLAVFIDDRDREFQAAARAQGFRRTEKGAEPMTALALDKPLQVQELPPEFQITDLEQDDRIEKTHRVLHRGFDHPGEPDPADVPGQRRMQSAPNFRKDLTVVVQAPDENFVAFCGMWFEPVNRIAYVEPVATDPDFRRMGLGRAAVLEGIRRCARLGATVAYVGSTMPFYLSMGFRETYTQFRWVKRL